MAYLGGETREQPTSSKSKRTLIIDPGTLEDRLRAAGFADARVDVAGDRVRFAATIGR